MNDELTNDFAIMMSIVINMHTRIRLLELGKNPQNNLADLSHEDVKQWLVQIIDHLKNNKSKITNVKMLEEVESHYKYLKKLEREER